MHMETWTHTCTQFLLLLISVCIMLTTNIAILVLFCALGVGRVEGELLSIIAAARFVFSPFGKEVPVLLPVALP